MGAAMQHKEPVRFTFDNVFSDEEAPVVVPAQRRKLSLTEEEIEAIRAEAREEGRAQGINEGYAQGEAAVRASQDQAAADALMQIAARLPEVFAQAEEEARETKSFAARLGLMAARKLAARLIAERPVAEVEAVFAECITHLNREPHLVLRVADGLSPLLKDKVDQLCHERGMTEQVLLIGDKDVPFGDCQIEWGDGGATRSLADIDRELTEIVNRYVESLQPAGPEKEQHNG
ncbi:hypothetical protein ACSHT0_06350 [Tepidicaulis sp. LMO-SS28]|uniref:hypothetical protein n=1 Tax=Tepidicaulis sp. LMO-SS28 TaxID=3447455 RepID=UPI003EE1B8BA